MAPRCPCPNTCKSRSPRSSTAACARKWANVTNMPAKYGLRLRQSSRTTIVGFSIFHDMGNVFARPQEMLSSLGRFHQPNQEFCFQEITHLKCNYNYASHAIGVGVRYQTPIGP